MTFLILARNGSIQPIMNQIHMTFLNLVRNHPNDLKVIRKKTIHDPQMTFQTLAKSGSKATTCDNPHESQPSEELGLTNRESTNYSHDLDKEQLEITIRKMSL